MLVICYPRCSTCKKALKYLDSNDIKYEYRDISVDNPSYDELKLWFKQSGLPLKRFFNTSGLVYRDLNLKDKLKTMNENEQLRILSSNGMLVKRPLVIKDNTILVGFKEKEWEEKLL